MANGKGLTDKQKRFCREYVKDSNATQAALRAGYSEKTAKDIACENLAKPNIREYIDELMAKARQDEPSAIADANEVLRFFTSMMRGEVISEELVIDGMAPAHFEPTPPTQQTRLKAATELAKRWGLNISSVEVNAAVPVVIKGGEDLVD